jgi:hypothetical protein
MLRAALAIRPGGRSAVRGIGAGLNEAGDTERGYNVSIARAETDFPESACAETARLTFCVTRGTESWTPPPAPPHPATNAAVHAMK